MEINAEQYMVVVDNGDGTSTLKTRFRSPIAVGDLEEGEIVEEIFVIEKPMIEFCLGITQAGIETGNYDLVDAQVAAFQKAATSIPNDVEEI